MARVWIGCAAGSQAHHGRLEPAFGETQLLGFYRQTLGVVELWVRRVMILLRSSRAGVLMESEAPSYIGASQARWVNDCADGGE
ncbi:hypothetical protein ACFC8N_34320 [Streptomyces sp. NPDC055966]|uniref:hypothetical protein n=1 Tax=Streptomyces sp. NPDC055966 TaxID=3345669 RepID=UPI0035DFBA47